MANSKMVREFSVHKHIFWLSAYAPGGAQPLVDQTPVVLERAAAWINAFLAKSGLAQITLPDVPDAHIFFATEQVPGVELVDRFARIPSSNGLQFLFELRRNDDVIWLYAQLAATKPLDLEEGQRLDEFFPQIERGDDILGVFTALGVWADEPQRHRELAARWLGRAPTDRLLHEIHLAGKTEGRISLFRAAKPEDAVVCIYDVEDDEISKQLLFRTLPDLARHFSKLNHLFEQEYKGKIAPHLGDLLRRTYPVTSRAETLIEGGLQEAELEEAETLIGKLVGSHNAFTTALADTAIVRSALKSILRNAEFSLADAPPALSIFYESSLEYFRRAGEQIDIDSKRFHVSEKHVSTVLRGVELCANLLRTQIENHENKRADIRNILIAVVGVLLAFAQIFTPDVVRSLINMFHINVEKEQYLLIFSVQLMPLVLVAIFSFMILRGWRYLRILIFTFLIFIKFLFLLFWKKFRLLSVVMLRNTRNIISSLWRQLCTIFQYLGKFCISTKFRRTDN